MAKSIDKEGQFEHLVGQTNKDITLGLAEWRNGVSNATREVRSAFRLRLNEELWHAKIGIADDDVSGKQLWIDQRMRPLLALIEVEVNKQRRPFELNQSTMEVFPLAVAAIVNPAYVATLSPQNEVDLAKMDEQDLVCLVEKAIKCGYLSENTDTAAAVKIIQSRKDKYKMLKTLD